MEIFTNERKGLGFTIMESIRDIGWSEFDDLGYNDIWCINQEIFWPGNRQINLKFSPYRSSTI